MEDRLEWKEIWARKNNLQAVPVHVWHNEGLYLNDGKSQKGIYAKDVTKVKSARIGNELDMVGVRVRNEDLHLGVSLADWEDGGALENNRKVWKGEGSQRER